MSIIQVPILSDQAIAFKNAEERIVTLYLPGNYEILSSIIQIEGLVLNETIDSDTVDTNTTFLYDSSDATSQNCTSVIIDFHQFRTITGFRIETDSESISGKTITNCVCVMRVWGGTQWYLPVPTNLFGFKVDGGHWLIDTSFPPIKTNKIMVSFVRLQKAPSINSYVDFNGLAINDLMEIMNFENLKAVEEPVELTFTSMEIRTRDALSSFSIGLMNKPPIHMESAEFVNQSLVLRDIAADINSMKDELSPVEKENCPLSDDDKDTLKDGESYRILPISITTATSGILHITEFRLEHVFGIKTFDVLGNKKNDGMLQFMINDARTEIVPCTLLVALPDEAIVTQVSFNMMGDLLNERWCTPSEITPKGIITNADIRITAAAGDILYSFFTTDEAKTLCAIALDLALISDSIQATLLILQGKPDTGVPDLESPLCATIAVTMQQSEENASSLYHWQRFDLDEDSTIEAGKPYWFALEIISGEITCRADRTAFKEFVPTMRKKGDDPLLLCGPYADMPIALTSRFIVRPDDMTTYCHATIDNNEFTIPLDALSGINTDIVINIKEDKQKNKIKIKSKDGSNNGRIALDIHSKSEGVVTISDFHLTYKDEANKVFIEGIP